MQIRMKKKMREHEREETHTVLARGRAHDAGDELVGHLGERLHAARNAGAAARTDRRDKAAHRHREQHVEAGIRQREIAVSAIGDRDDRVDRELLDRVDRRARFGRHVLVLVVVRPAGGLARSARRQTAPRALLARRSRGPPPLSGGFERDKRKSCAPTPPFGEVRRTTIQHARRNAEKEECNQERGVGPEQTIEPPAERAPRTTAEMNSLPARMRKRHPGVASRRPAATRRSASSAPCARHYALSKATPSAARAAGVRHRHRSLRSPSGSVHCAARWAAAAERRRKQRHSWRRSTSVASVRPKSIGCSLRRAAPGLRR